MNLPEARPEMVWIEKKIRAVLRANKVGLLPEAIGSLVDEVWSICQTERATAALLLIAAHDQYGPLNDKKIQMVANLIEAHEEHAPGKCTIDGQSIV